MELESRVVLDGRFDLGSCMEFVTAQSMRVCCYVKFVNHLGILVRHYLTKNMSLLSASSFIILLLNNNSVEVQHPQCLWKR